MEVEAAVSDMLEKGADVTELLAKSNLTAEEKQQLQTSAAEFGKQLQFVNAHLDDRIKRTLGDEVPLLNNSYKEREELEVRELLALFFFVFFLSSSLLHRFLC
jgi:hypothetical protein